jgi:hypothetical protein
LGRRPRVGDQGAGGLRVRLKAKARGLGGSALGRPARMVGGRCVASGARRKKGRRRPGTDRWGRSVRGREKRLGLAGLREAG